MAGLWADRSGSSTCAPSCPKTRSKRPICDVFLSGIQYTCLNRNMQPQMHLNIWHHLTGATHGYPLYSLWCFCVTIVTTSTLPHARHPKLWGSRSAVMLASRPPKSHHHSFRRSLTQSTPHFHSFSRIVSSLSSVFSTPKPKISLANVCSKYSKM